ncbi:MAG TPA: PKD domain-containing protein [Bacteroidia bacterium]|nr:PKD domain-containing protein [Bacteroidia bacterium]
MKHKLALLLFCLFLGLTTSSFAQSCDNVGFENGNTQNWTCMSGTFGDKTPPKCSSTLTIALTNGNCQNQGGIDGTVTPVNFSQNRHTIMSQKNVKDPNSNNTVNVVAPASMFPSGVNNYSFRLGNAVGGDLNNPNGLAYAEGIKYTFLVSKANAGLTYMYAAFVKEQVPDVHPTNMAPRFEIKITDQSGAQITCGYYQVIAGATKGFKDGAKDTYGNWKYTDWTKVGLDLSGYIGQNVTIEFRTTDCYPSNFGISNNNGKIDTVCNSWTSGSHSAYAYIDLYCTPIEIISPPVCANQATVQLCGPPGYASYQWPSGQPGIVPPLNTQCVTINNPKAGNKYTVNMTSVAGGCPTSTTITLSGSDFNVKDAAVCDGAGPTKITAVPTIAGNYTWKWEPSTNLSCSDCPDPTFTPGTTTTYTVTMIDKNIANCNQTKKVTVTVGASFTVETQDAEICEGDEVTLTATGADTYVWNPGNIPGESIKVKPATTTTYTVTGTKASATCPGTPTATATVTVGLKPIVKATDITICAGETATLTGSVTGGGSTGQWIGGKGTFNPDRFELTGTYKPTPAEEAAGKVQLTLLSEDPSGPCNLDSAKITINIVPPVTSDAGPDQTVCETETVQLNAKFGGAGTGGTWSGGTGTFDNKTSINAIYTLGAGDISQGKVKLKFTVTNGSNATCPGGIDEMVINIDKKPSVSAGADITICAGDAVKLNGSIGGSATSAVWSGGAGLFSPNNKTVNATYTPTADEVAAKKVTLTLTTDPSGKCPIATSTMNIIINPVATIDAGPVQKACVGTAVQLEGVVGGGATKGTWSGGSGTYSPNNNVPNPLYTPSQAEATAKKVILTFTSEDPQGPCPAVSDTVTIFIDLKPVAIAGDYKGICDGQVIQLNGKVTGAASTGTWSGGLGLFKKDNKDLKGTYTPTPQDIAAGKVTLILITDKTGLCPVDTDQVTIPIYANPVVRFTVDTPRACPEHCVHFTDSSTVEGSSKITKWYWNFSNGTDSVKNPHTCFPLSGFYDVTLTAVSDHGCSTTVKKEQYIQTYKKPTAAFVANPNAVSQYDPTIHFYDRSSSDVVTWKWNLGDGKIISPKTQNPIHKYEVGVAGNYLVKLFVVNANGCVDSTRQIVEVLPEFTFYIPNAFTPVRTDGTNDTFFGKGVGIVSYHLWIFDRWGNMVFNSPDIDAGWDGRANGGELPAQQDVFVWKVHLTDVFGRKHDYIGTVTLVR